MKYEIEISGKKYYRIDDWETVKRNGFVRTAFMQGFVKGGLPVSGIFIMMYFLVSAAYEFITAGSPGIMGILSSPGFIIVIMASLMVIPAFGFILVRSILKKADRELHEN